ncbi:MBL fold metallo-hydrolase [Candidatus Woesearchaeota archaeon]|nr:MBL fold metallo-hydrolase [Candidatus Woesearchaeota archaeon]
MVEGLRWLGQSGFMLRGHKIIYLDPWQIKETQKADFIFITHSHYDHCDRASVQQILDKKTIIYGPADCGKILGMPVHTVKPGDSFTVEGIAVDVVPAYNINKPFHPKANAWVGYILTVEGKRYYHAGDTDNIPEMQKIKNIDVAMFPVGGTYTMNGKEAADAANIIQPKLALPIHWGKIVGTKADAETFKKNCSCFVEIL